MVNEELRGVSGSGLGCTFHYRQEETFVAEAVALEQSSPSHNTAMPLVPLILIIGSLSHVHKLAASLLL